MFRTQAELEARLPDSSGDEVGGGESGLRARRDAPRPAEGAAYRDLGLTGLSAGRYQWRAPSSAG